MRQFPGFTRLRRNLSNEVFAGLVVELLDALPRSVAPLYAAQTEVATQFHELARKEGLGAALKWRKAQFET